MRHFKASFGCLALLGLAACNDHGDNATTSPPASTTVISGVAAMGAPIGNGQVSLHCGGGATASSTTSPAGGWSATIATALLPCAVQVTGGTPAGTLYSIARGATGVAGTTANITPATDLALAAAITSATGIAIDTWFTTASDAQRQQTATAIDAASADLRSALIAAGYTLPSATFNPFVDAIDPALASDAYDHLLEAYKAALAAAAKTYDAARSDYISGGGLVHSGTTTPPGPEPGTLAGKIGTAFAGTYVLSCGPSGGTVNHTIVIKSDGSSTLDNVAVVDASHAGSVSVERTLPSPTSTGFQVSGSRLDGSSDAPLFVISFKSDGTIDSTSATSTNLVFAGGALATCTGVSGTSNPTAYDHAKASAAFALNQTLNCSATNTVGGAPSPASPSGPTAFGIGTDGAYTLGGLKVTPADFNSVAQLGSYQADDELTFDSAAVVDDLQVGYGSGQDKRAFTVLINRSGNATRVQYANGFDIGTCIP